MTEVEELPIVEAQDIKLFGKWSTEDVNITDISLTVSSFYIKKNISVYFVIITRILN